MTDKPDIVERAKEDLGLAYKAFEFLGSSAPAEFDNLLVDVSELLSAIEALRANINRLREAASAIVAFHDGPFEAKRPDAFELRINKIRAILKDTGND